VSSTGGASKAHQRLARGPDGTPGFTRPRTGGDISLLGGHSDSGSDADAVSVALGGLQALSLAHGGEGAQPTTGP
jgi:hypothetical protein